MWSHNHWYLVQLYSFFFFFLIVAFFSPFFKNSIYLFLTSLCLLTHCAGFSLVVEDGACSQVTVAGIAVGSLVAEQGLQGVWTPVVSGCRLNPCGARAQCVVCGLSWDLGFSPYPLHCRVDPQPLGHQRSPRLHSRPQGTVAFTMVV